MSINTKIRDYAQKKLTTFESHKKRIYVIFE